MTKRYEINRHYLTETSNYEKTRLAQTGQVRFQCFKEKSDKQLHQRSSSFDTKLKLRRDEQTNSIHKRSRSNAVNELEVDKTALVKSRSTSIGAAKIDVVGLSNSQTNNSLLRKYLQVQFVERNIKRLINPEEVKLIEQDDYNAINQLNFDKFAENQKTRYNRIDNLEKSLKKDLIPRFDTTPKSGIKTEYRISITGPPVVADKQLETDYPRII